VCNGKDGKKKIRTIGGIKNVIQRGLIGRREERCQEDVRE
jgi:hypothetical protein